MIEKREFIASTCEPTCDILRSALPLANSDKVQFCSDVEYIVLFNLSFNLSLLIIQLQITVQIYRGYYTVARRYEFYVRVRYCSCHENIKFISSSQRVMFFLLYGD